MLMHHPTRTRALAAAAARARILVSVALALVVCGCGERTVTEPSAVLRLTVGEYAISPESVRAYAGTVRLEVRNDGVLAHQIAISGTPAGGARLYEQTATVFPGRRTITASFAIAPGSYHMFDPGANYADLGSYGTLTVVAR